MVPCVRSQSFGQLPGGEAVAAWRLKGSAGLELEVITYGAIVTKLLVPDRSGNLADVVLGYDHLSGYLSDRAYLGAMIGRVAGRISGGRFSLEGRNYELAQNDGPNHLHGGREGFNRKNWKAKPLDRADGAPSLMLSCQSPDGEEGYPGNVNVTVTFTVTHDNTFLIQTEATTDRTTLLNLTHHSYFNLAGEGSGPVFDHWLQVFAETAVPMDEHFTLLGRMTPVDKYSNDFCRPRSLGTSIPTLFRRHGDLYRLGGGDGIGCARAARVVHPPSGRVLEVSTTSPYMQFYTGAALDGSSVGKSGVAYTAHSGLCLECHGYPDSANAPLLGDITLRPGVVQKQTSAYAFRSSPLSEFPAAENDNPARG